MNEIYFCPDCKAKAGEHIHGENQLIFVCPQCGKKIVNMQARWVLPENFSSIEEAEAHFLHLEEQIKRLGNTILRLYPDLPGEMYELGACGLAARLLIEGEAKRAEMSSNASFLEASDNSGSAIIRAKLSSE